MTKNIGILDRVVRVAIGLVLLAFALRIGFGDTGWNWLGWIGVIPLLTALLGTCPLYSFLGCSTYTAPRR